MKRKLTSEDYKFYPGADWMCTGCNPNKNGRLRDKVSDKGIYRLLDLADLKNDCKSWLCPLCFQEQIVSPIKKTRKRK